MSTYPSPCITCTVPESNCTGKACRRWQIRYRYRQKQINIKALQVARGETPVKSGVWVYMHPDEYRDYLEHSPCERCFARELCDAPCQRYLLWYDAKMEQARKRVNLCL